MFLEVDYHLTQQQDQKLTHQEQEFLHLTGTMLVIIIFITHHHLNLALVYLVSVHDMLMAEQLNFVEELRDLEHQRVLRGASQMLMIGLQVVMALIDLFLIHLKLVQQQYLIGTRVLNMGMLALLNK